MLALRIGRWGRIVSRAAWHAATRVATGHDLTYAASVAYWALLSLFPFLLLVLAVLGAMTADNEVIIGVVTTFFPARVAFVTRQLDALRTTSVSIGVVGALSLIWAALGFFGSVTTAVNYAWGVENPRGFFRHRLFTIVMMVVAGAGFVATAVLSSAVPVLEASWFVQALSQFPGLDLLERVLVRSISTVLSAAVFALVFYVVPNVKVRWRDVWPGAVLTGVAWRLAFAAFAEYVGRVSSRLSQIHGSLATVVVFLVWVYVSAVILLYGVQFTAAYGRLRAGHRLAPAHPAG